MLKRFLLSAAIAVSATLSITVLASRPAQARPLCYLVTAQGQVVNLTAMCARGQTATPPPAPAATTPATGSGSIVQQWLELIAGQPGASVLRQSWASGGAINPDRALAIYCRNLAQGMTPDQIRQQDAQAIIGADLSGLAREAVVTNLAAIAVLARTNC